MSKALYYLQHWKLAVHLIFSTYYFGVNNQWWSRHPSMLGHSFLGKLIAIITIAPLIRKAQALRVRSACGWLSHDTYNRYLK